MNILSVSEILKNIKEYNTNKENIDDTLDKLKNNMEYNKTTLCEVRNSKLKKGR